METLDHIVVNTLTGMDDAAALFEGLGFTLTPRGHHSLGSVNHLMMTPGAYLELVGVPPTGLQRADVLDSPLGLNGLVLRSGDADETFDTLARRGLSPSAPVSFSRPVTVDGRRSEARFRTVRVPAGLFPAGRVYFCQHLTPDLVWREEWMDHPNGFDGFGVLTVTSPDPAAQVARYEGLCGGTAAASGSGWRLGTDGCEIDLVPGGGDAFAKIGVTFRDLDALRSRALALDGVEWRDETPDRASLWIPSLRLHLECGRRP
ncbi:hypothetical protein N825_30935 [Skermanella stibiiresistens SB22]|uniref:Glyoxalase-like domain-containing protein n=1 Tax=Skermanella stibiiresistens SB22 TaxID=1385369 RepID=W9H8S2_9PROT|nr:VOC family protein [Skermanella stibiiresistens]EWY41087.1 hypothetical protein N825_30935 [Skermanella stibiiresistens SB22]